MTWAFDLPLEPRAKIALLAIADHANDDGMAWPSRDLIAIKSSQSRTTINRRMKFLSDLGVLRVFERYRDDGSQTTDEVRLDMTLTPEEVMRRVQTLTAAQKAENDHESECDETPEGGVSTSIPPPPLQTPRGVTADTPGVSLRTPPNEPSVEPDRIGDARARAPAVFTEGSKALASAFWKALGITDPLEIPPELSGIDYRATMWERAGWPPDLIDTETRKFAHDRPFKPISYFEKVFATSFAKRQTPLPVVEVRNAEKLTVTGHGTSRGKSGGSIVAALDRRIADIEAENAADPALPKADLLLLPSGPVCRSG